MYPRVSFQKQASAAWRLSRTHFHHFNTTDPRTRNLSFRSSREHASYKSDHCQYLFKETVANTFKIFKFTSYFADADTEDTQRTKTTLHAYRRDHETFSLKRVQDRYQNIIADFHRSCVEVPTVARPVKRVVNHYRPRQSLAQLQSRLRNIKYSKI